MLYKFEGSSNQVARRKQATKHQAFSIMLTRNVIRRAGRTLLSRSESTAASSSKSITPKNEANVVPQAPNRAELWSTNQRQRPAANSSPRFEQTSMELQPNTLSAIELISKEPIRIVHARKAVCDGGMCTVRRTFTSLTFQRWRAARTSQDIH